MEKKHINRKKSHIPDKTTDFKLNSKIDNDEWSRFEPSIGEKILSEEIFEVPDRAITFDRRKFVKNKEEEFNEKTKEFKDDFTNTAQYLKFINAHLAEKKNHLDKVVAEKDKFSDDISILNPKLLTNEQLDKKNYTKLKAEDVRRVLENLEEEKELLKEKIEHFTAKISQANAELVNKNNQVDKIKSELSLSDLNDESVQTSIISEDKKVSEDKTVSDIQQELKSILSRNESEKIFGAINSLVVLLNSKNQATLNDLRSVKSEFNKMKQNYNKIMNDLEKKKGK